MMPWALRVAGTLCLADLMADGLSRPEELAACSGAHPGSLERLLRYLVCRGYFAEPEPGRFTLNDRAETLLSAHPSGLRARMDADGAFGRTDQVISHLLTTIRTGRPAYAQVHGRPFFDDLAVSAGRSAPFDAVMRDRLGVDLPHLLDAYDWAAAGSVADVGGGTGGLLAALLTAHPGLHGTLVDLPVTAERAAQSLRSAGLADRCQIVAGNFFEPLPGGRHVYVLRNILHDWDDERATAILRNCRQAAGPDGRILVIELVMGDADTLTMTTAHDLFMLLICGGKERDLAQFGRLAADAELHLSAARALPSGSWLLELRTPAETEETG
ncbi:O-methyltransferase, family 2 [[Actinomadura] parvosata subsp. kistnae]|nr:O-methyltransferase, family 2 [Actinomadura parvosata subsp. kistnae]